jgi:hypothetical protein
MAKAVDERTKQEAFFFLDANFRSEDIAFGLDVRGGPSISTQQVAVLAWHTSRMNFSRVTNETFSKRHKGAIIGLTPS